MIYPLDAGTTCSWRKGRPGRAVMLAAGPPSGTCPLARPRVSNSERKYQKARAVYRARRISTPTARRAGKFQRERLSGRGLPVCGMAVKVADPAIFCGEIKLTLWTAALVTGVPCQVQRRTHLHVNRPIKKSPDKQSPMRISGPSHQVERRTLLHTSSMRKPRYQRC